MHDEINQAVDAPGTGRPVEILHESPTTRVLRLGQPPASVIYKEPLGPEAAQRLRHEKQILTRLAGVAGIPGLATGSYPSGVLVMQDCGGIPLAQVLRAGPLELSTLLPLASHLVQAIAAMHRAGVIHRDINPANILLSRSGEPVLIDFGLALVAEQHSSARHQDGIVGTLAYLAPEQTGRTGHKVDQRADLYALGATLYEMATGRPPFEGEDALQLIHDHLVRTPVAARQVDSRVPRGLSDVIQRLLAKAPEQRFQSAEGLLHDLQRLGGELRDGDDRFFELGQHDFPARLAPPEQLVGRDAELSVLQSAFIGALSNTVRTLLVEGAPGVGKTTLINELKPLVSAAGGWFVYAKFDQYQHDSSAHGGTVQAMRELGRLLLAEPKEELSGHRERILQRLGRAAGLIAQLPEFGLLLGPQPPLSAADPARADERLTQASVDLLCAVASVSRPLVMVLDDLQWASARSLRVFDDVMNQTDLHGLLLVGAYRGAEIDATHALALMLPRWRRRIDPLMELTLENLRPAGATELVGRMLRLQTEGARELAEAVGTLTAGNPFDTVEMLNALRADGVLRVSLQGWQWDPGAIRKFVGRGNVVDLLAARIGRLPSAARALLECMSCLGGSVSHKLLRVVAGLARDQLEDHLLAALEDGLVVQEPDGEDCLRLRHDRVQQAVLARMSPAQRTALQLRMARRLAKQSDFRQHMTQQYLGCAELLTNAGERRRAARLFHDMATRLADAPNYRLAETYSTAASKLLATLNDAADSALSDQVEVARHAALYSLGRLDEADAIYAVLQNRLTDPVALTEPACLQVRSLESRTRFAEAVDLGIGLLARLGLAAPSSYVGANARLDAMCRWVREDKSADFHTRPALTEPRALAAAKLLSRLQRSAFAVNKAAATWMMHESQRLWVDHGPCGALVLSLCRLSAILIAARQDFRAGFDAARHVLAVGEERAFEPDCFEARIVFAVSASHWFEPLEHTIEHVMRARESLQGGDTFYVCYSYRGTIPALLDCAATLETFEAEIDRSHILNERAGDHHDSLVNLIERQFLHSLRGKAQDIGRFGDAEFEQQSWFARLRALPMAMFNYQLRKCLAFSISGNVAALASHSAAAMALVDGVPGYYTLTHAYLFTALAAAWQMQTQIMEPGNAATLQGDLKAGRAWLAARAADQPLNFGHLVLLLDAEQAWVDRNLWKAAAAFDAAMAEAGNRPRPWHRALITERAGCFHLAHGLEQTGRTLLAQACHQYQTWGAAAKVELLQRQHPWLRLSQPAYTAGPSHLSFSVTSDALDLVGVLRASQALSSETCVERLTARVVEVLAALSGATKVLVLSCNDDQWVLQAPGPGEPSIPVAQAAERGLLPLSAFGYAERTGEALVVEDAIHDDRFARDPYFAGVPLCSLLLVPIAGQGATRAMLLLENRLGRAAFNAQRLDAVTLIAGQLAVSLANAQLYESLEQRVQARTRELQETQAQLVTTARRAGMAEIANNVLHNVGNVLNSINVSARVMRRTVDNSRIDGLARAVDLINHHEIELGNFIASDPRGKALPAYLNELVSALQMERDATLSDLDRLARSVDHITYVVATQQSHAGPSSVLETARLQELIEEALLLSAESVDRFGITIVRRYEEVPPTALDKQRLVQILVNLIGNAAQAMEGVPAKERRLAVAIGLVQGGERLRITVQDNGEGISADNLTRIFAHGFTTRSTGHGFGLHSSALAAMEMGGSLTAHSDGIGLGAVFTVELPMNPRAGFGTE